MDYKLEDGELTPEKLQEFKTFQIVIRLFSNYIKQPTSWGKLLWELITRFFVVFICVITYFFMLGYQSTRMILIGLYIFFAIFWSFFPYIFKCVLIYKITSISYCIHALFYAILGLICWIIALAMYNTEQFEDAKAGRVKVK